MRYGHWPHSRDPQKGAILVLNGRTEFIEKYLEAIQRLHGRGFGVFSMDWRGQGLSDRMLGDPTRGFIGSYGQYVADLSSMIDKVVRPACQGPLYVLAHSMGGNILLQYLEKHPHTVHKGILICPMINILTSPVPQALARWGCKAMVKLAGGERIVPSLQRHDMFRTSFEKNHMTHDRARFQRVRQILRREPRLKVVSLTWSWLAATFEAIDAIWRPGFAQRIKTPLLVVAAGGDRVISNDALVRYCDQLADPKIVFIKDAFHEILLEQDRFQDQFWQALDRFIES